MKSAYCSFILKSSLFLINPMRNALQFAVSLLKTINRIKVCRISNSLNYEMHENFGKTTVLRRDRQYRKSAVADDKVLQHHGNNED